MNKIDEFKVTKLKVNFTPLTKVSLPPFKGTAIRGSFDKTIRQIVCGTNKRKCDSCSKNSNCSYYTIFTAAPNPKSKMMKLYERPRAPYAIRPRSDTLNELTCDNLLEFGHDADRYCS